MEFFTRMKLSISSLCETEDWCLSWLSISYNVHLKLQAHTPITNVWENNGFKMTKDYLLWHEELRSCQSQMDDKRNWTEQKINCFSYTRQRVETSGQMCTLMSIKKNSSRARNNVLTPCKRVVTLHFKNKSVLLLKAEAEWRWKGAWQSSDEAGLGTLPYGQPGISPCANANSKEEFEGLYEEREINHSI